MRNIYAIVLFTLFTTSGAFGQEIYAKEELAPRDIAKNEVHLNVLNILIFGALDVGYERVLNDYSSVGVQIFSKVFSKNEGEDIDLSEVYAKEFSVTSKFKFFLKEAKVAHGFYAEAFGMISGGTNEKEMETIDPGTGLPEMVEQEVEYTDFALGFGIGGKFVAKHGFLMDVSFGIGRNLFDRNSPDIVILPAVNFGYRF